jgi:hypothetical protein
MAIDISLNDPVVLISSSTAENTSFENMTTLYASVGYTETLSILYLSIFIVCAVIGCALNTLTFSVLQIEKAATSVYVYLKLITLISLLLNVLQILFALVQGRYYLSVGNSYTAQAYISYCYKPLINTLGFYKFVLNAHLTWDRILAMRPSLKTKFNQSPRKACTLTFIITILFMAPHYFVYIPVKYIIYLPSASSYMDFFVTETTKFSKEKSVIIFLNSIAAFRSVFMCLVDIILNGLTIYFFEKFLSNKTNLMTSAINRQPSLKGSKLTDTENGDGDSLLMTPLAVNLGNQPSIASCSNLRGVPNSLAVEKSITKMVIVHCSFSLAHHLLLLGTFFYTVSSGRVENSAILIIVTNYVSVVRQAANFFLFYFFNTKFQKDVDIMLSRCFKNA